MNAKTGRPLSDNPKAERLYVRITQDEKEMIFEFCRQNNVSILELIRAGMKAYKKK